MTNAEAILWSKLRRNQLNGLKFRRQHPVMAYVADFACIEARLIVEVDGPTHDAPRERHHDERRDALMRRAGWRVLRVANDDIYHNLFPTLDLISSCARCAPSVPDCVRDTSPVNGGGKSDHED